MEIVFPSSGLSIMFILSVHHIQVNEEAKGHFVDAKKTCPSLNADQSIAGQ